MIYELLDWEMVEADQGYVGQPNKIHMKNELGVCENQFEAKPRARARGETINGRFKSFHILMDRYRHKISMHSHVFCAVAVLTQISLTTVSPTFKVNYPACDNFTRMSFPTLTCFLVFSSFYIQQRLFSQHTEFCIWYRILYHFDLYITLSISNGCQK